MRATKSLYFLVFSAVIFLPFGDSYRYERHRELLRRRPLIERPLRLPHQRDSTRVTIPRPSTRPAAAVVPTHGAQVQKKQDEREGRFFFPNLFTVVRFANSPCDSGGNINGTCYTASECQKKGGKGTSKCAEGYGVCCTFQLTCGSKATANNTYFTNQNYPSAYDGTGFCQLTVERVESNICQLRLDFDEFTLAAPDSAGSCQNDQLVMSGGSSVPVICGVNTGQHVYVDIGNTGGTSQLTVVTSGPTFERKWKIKISQIACNASYAAPEGCTQYYTTIAGEVSSFNYDESAGQHLANQQYSICIRAESGFCGISYTQCPDSTNTNSQSFSITGDPTSSGASATGDTNCAMDWIMIGCSSDVSGSSMNSDNKICTDRMCGSKLSSIHNDNAAPKTIYCCWLFLYCLIGFPWIFFCVAFLHSLLSKVRQ